MPQLGGFNTATSYSGILQVQTAPPQLPRTASSIGIIIRGANGRSNTVTFTITTPSTPTITSITPSSGPAGSTNVTVNVTNLIPIFRGSQRDAVFGNIGGSTFSVVLPTPTNLYNGSISIPIPSNLAPGVVNVTLQGDNGTSNAVQFTVTAPIPTITSFTPTMGGAGTRVVVRGTNFQDASGNSIIQRVSIGGVDIPIFVAQSASEMAVFVPSGARTGRIVVVTQGGTATSPTDFVVTTTGVPMGFAELPTRIFPNPVAGTVSIETRLDAASLLRVQIINLAGQVLLQEERLLESGRQTMSIDAASLQSGVYFVRIEAGKQAWVEKITKTE